MKSFLSRVVALSVALTTLASFAYSASSDLSVSLSSPSVLRYHQQVTVAITGLPSHSGKRNPLIAFLACSTTLDPWTDQSGSWYTYQVAAPWVTFTLPPSGQDYFGRGGPNCAVYIQNGSKLGTVLAESPVFTIQ